MANPKNWLAAMKLVSLGNDSWLVLSYLGTPERTPVHTKGDYVSGECPLLMLQVCRCETRLAILGLVLNVLLMRFQFHVELGDSTSSVQFP